MAGTTQLQVYNNALLMLGERTLASLTENREPRRVLDTIWQDNLIDNCLSQGPWVFAIRTAQMVSDPGIDPLFGYNQAFERPADLVMTTKVCSDEFFTTPITRYVEENGIFYSFLQNVYISYVSNDPAYGNNMVSWPGPFVEYISTYAAWKGAIRISGDKEKVLLMAKAIKDARTNALNRNAMEGPSVFPATGTWVDSRRGNSVRFDGGNRSSFYG